MCSGSCIDENDHKRCKCSHRLPLDLSTGLTQRHRTQALKLSPCGTWYCTHFHNRSRYIARGSRHDTGAKGRSCFHLTSAMSYTFCGFLIMSPGSGSRVLVLSAIRPFTWGTRGDATRQPFTNCRGKRVSSSRRCLSVKLHRIPGAPCTAGRELETYYCTLSWSMIMHLSFIPSCIMEGRSSMRSNEICEMCRSPDIPRISTNAP